GDGKACLDHVHPEARELQRNLDLFLRVERDAGRLLAVAQGRVEDQYSVGFSLLGHVTPSDLDWNSSRAGVRPRPAAGVLFPPRGEEKKSQVEVQRHVEGRVAAARSPYKLTVRPVTNPSHEVISSSTCLGTPESV